MKTLRKRIGALLCAAALVLTLLPGAAMAAGSPADGTDNTGSTYNGSWAVPVPSYLYQDGENLVRVEYDQGWHIYQANGDVTTVRPEQIIVESYSPQFQLLESRTMELELPLWGGFYAGADYNFLVFGQENPTENDSTEVIRVVKYDKDWNRLGQASLYDINTTVPFEAGSLRMDEYGGYLYVRTSHEMYTSSDGLNHQANLTFSVREADMAVTDSYSGVANTSAGYVSHSFNQFILVDEQGNIVTLDHGDGFPRGAVLMRYDAKAGEDLFITASGTHWLAVSDEVLVRSWPGGVGENTTGAQVTGLAETATGYLTAFSDTGKGAASRIGADVSNVYLSYTPKDANGKEVEPFASEGTTYLPVRAIGEALGKKVTWDGSTATVYVGDVPGQGTDWMQKLPPYQVSSRSTIYDGSDPREYFTVAGVNHTSGVVLNDYWYEGEAYALWNTNLQYNTMTFSVGHIDGANDYHATISVYLDGNYYTEYDIAFNGGTQTITIPLNRAANVDIRMRAFTVASDGTKSYEGYVSHYDSKYGIYDISFS